MEEQTGRQLTYENALELMENGYVVTNKTNLAGALRMSFKGKCYAFLGISKQRVLISGENFQDIFNQSTGLELKPINKQVAIDMVKTIRQAIDFYIYLLGPYLKPEREVSLVKTELQLAFMWLGYVCGEMGDKIPYPSSFNEKSPIIEPHADKHVLDVVFMETFSNFDETGRVKLLRHRVSELVDIINWLYAKPMYNFVENTPKFIHLPILTGAEALKHLINANLWLGQVLNNIRERNELAQRQLTPEEKQKIANSVKNY